MWSLGQDYLQFNKVHDVQRTISFCSFAQEADGLIWAGGEDGLYSYDGYDIYPHFQLNTLQSSRINAMQHDATDRLYLGSDAGLFVFNVDTYQYEQLELNFPSNIRALVLVKNVLWIGSLDGLFQYDLVKNELKSFETRAYPQLKNTTVYSFCVLGNELYVGTYNGLYVYSQAEDAFRRITLPLSSVKGNEFINSLLYDEKQHCLWIGTEGSLLKYALTSGKIEQLKSTQNNSIKTLSLGLRGELYVGTDLGLYIYQSGQLHHHQHDSRDSYSLANDIIWSLFTDTTGNIWIGSDNGISFLPYNELIKNIPLYNLTGSSSGNLLQCIFKDSRGFYWFGGTNGLIRMQRRDEAFVNPIWYKVNDPKYAIPHGRIRDIYEDKEASLWLATDGGLNKYNYSTEQFEQFIISNELGTLNANWAYNILEDDQQRMWVSTCLGGIFVLSKEELARKDHKVKAVNNLNTSNGLSDMFIKKMLLDGAGRVWALSYSNTLDLIDSQLQISTIDTMNISNKSYLKVSADGRVWMSYDYGVLHIDPISTKVDTIEFSKASPMEVYAMENVDNDLWVATSNGIWVVNEQSYLVQTVGLETGKILSMYWDESRDELLLGRIDGLSIVKPKERNIDEHRVHIACTRVKVNDRVFLEGVNCDKEFQLKHQQNDLSFYITDYPYTSTQQQHLLYRLLGSDELWSSLSNQQHIIEFKNLKHGRYELQLAYINHCGQVSEEVKSISFRILPPWYYSWRAYVIYTLLLLGLLMWIIQYIRVKNSLHIEQINRRQVMEQSKEKVAFLQQISQKVFEPLSNVLLPISCLSFESKTKEPLSEVVENLIRINRLTNEIARFDGNTTGYKEQIISRFDLIYAIEMLTFQQHDHLVSFSSNVRVLIVELDRVKMESMFMNLLSNAIRFGDNKQIQVLLNYNDKEQQLKLQVVDKGLGISAEDLPYVFQKYYKVNSSMQGAGMGLYFAKAYAEQLGAVISLSSNVGKGTVANILLCMAPYLVNVESAGNDNLFAPEKDFDLTLEANMSNADIEFLAHITSIVESEIDDAGLNVAELCGRHHINYKQFYRRLKQLTNSTPSDFIRSIRMKKAALLLLQQEFNISEVMYMVGYTNSSYFSKCFKAEFGCTPMQYREREGK